MKKNLLLFIALLAFVPMFAQRKPLQTVSVTSLSGGCYSPSQGFLAVITEKKVAIYSTFAYDKITEIGVNKKIINDIAFSPDGKALALGGAEARVDMWDHQNQQLIGKIFTTGDILGLEYLTDDRMLILLNNKVLVYDIRSNIDKPDSKPLKVIDDHDGKVRSIAVSADGKIFATGGEDGKINIYNSETFGLVSTRILHTGWVRVLAISPDNQWIAGGDSEGWITIQHTTSSDSKKLEQARGWIRSITFSDDGKYVAAGNDKGEVYLFDAQKKSLVEKLSKAMAPVISLDFTPDGTRLAAVGLMSPVRVYNVMDLHIAPANQLKNKEDRTPPQILVSNPVNINDDKVRFYKDLLEIKGTLIDDSGVRSLKINNVNVPLKENNNFTIFLPLSMGDNPISIEARDINDNIALRKFTVTRRNMEGEEIDAASAKNYLVVVGIDDYEHWPKLNNAVKDASDITSVLMENYNFKFDNVTILKNEQATRANIYRSLRSLIEKVTPNDNLMIYYSGHGYFDQVLNEGYWIPSEAELNSTGEYLSNSDILKLIANIDSRHTFLVADACFSGSLFADSKRGYADNVEKFRSRWGLASGRLEVVSDGTVGQNSPFAGALLEFLKTNTKQKLAVSELVQYVKIKVAEVSKQTPLGNPLKVSGDEGGEFVLYKKL